MDRKEISKIVFRPNFFEIGLFGQERRQTGIICFPWRQRSWSCGVFNFKVEFQMHTILSNANGEFYTTMIYPCFSRSVCFPMGSPAWWRFGLCSSGSSLVSRWRDVTLVREFQMWRRRCQQTDPHWFQGRQMRFGGMLSTISWKSFMIYKVRLSSTANI